MRFDARFAFFVAISAVSLTFACQSDDGGSIYQEGDGTSDDEVGDDTTETSTESGGMECGYCEGTIFIPCEDGEPGEPEDCFEMDMVCVSGEGCLPCVPGETTCVGNDVHECDENGQPGELVEECDEEGEVCSEGDCANACEVVDDTPSNVGCEFWAADLPNERGISDAAVEPWGVVIANAGQTAASIIIERNIAPVGEPPDIVVVEQTDVPAGLLKTVSLPRAEVTGWTPETMDPPGPTGTAITNHGFRITSTAPIVVYQFNTFTNDFSNDASLLLPTAGLGTIHRVIGYYTANPIEVFPLAGIPDRSSVTVIGTEDQTEVKVRPGTNTVSDGQTIPVGSPDQEITVWLDKWETLNVASDGIPGDMTGTVVEANKPVSVFSTGERAIAPVSPPDGFPEPPDYDGDLCCTDHIEEQVFPASSLGSKYVVTHSPERSNGGWVEPDILRFMAVAEPASVTTSLPPPRDSFDLQPGEMFETWAQEDIIVESTTPIMVAQITVSQAYTVAYTGDPALTYFPAVDQYRDRYVFLTPADVDHQLVRALDPLRGRRRRPFDGQLHPRQRPAARRVRGAGRRHARRASSTGASSARSPRART